MITTFDDLLAHAAGLPERRVVVVSPTNTETFEAIRDAQRTLRVRFVLTGDADALGASVADLGIDSTRVEIRHCADVASSIKAAVIAVQEDNGGVLMKGSVDTGTLMKGVLDERSGLRTGRLLSDVFVFEYGKRNGNKLVMITDGGVTLAPDLKQKVELINNAVRVAHALGNEIPKVAVLSATEFVNPSLQSTIDAAVLAKMNDRGQITGCLVDGPFALDNALSDEAASEKRIASPVAGRADILLAPSIEAANALAKSTTYFAGCRLGHVIVGAAVPVLIPSRADKSDAKLLSIALGLIMCAG
jgi:phosphate butyryltransferase